jgi:uncharacterized protein
MDSTSLPPPVAMPPASPSSARTWETLCHLSALLGYVVPLGNFIGPLLVWQLKKNEFPSVDPHGKESLNFQISCLIYAIVSGLLIFVLIGIPLLVAVGVFDLVCVIIATIKVNNGDPWRYPLTLRLIN